MGIGKWVVGTGALAGGLYGAYRFKLLDPIIEKATGQKVYRVYLYPKEGTEPTQYTYGVKFEPAWKDAPEGTIPTVFGAESGTDVDTLVQNAVSRLKVEGITESAKVPFAKRALLKQFNFGWPKLVIVRSD